MPLLLRRVTSRALRPSQPPNAHFSVSTCQCARQRLSRRSSSRPVQTSPENDSSLNRDGNTLLTHDRPAVPSQPPRPASSHQAISPGGASLIQPQDSATQDTSTSGPYKHVLLASKSIRYNPAAAASSSSSSNITTRTSKPYTQQLSAAEKFFSCPCKFLYSAEALRHHPMNSVTPEIAVLGSSNVGKSTLLNALVGQPRAARVSQKPGRTTLMNAYGVGPPPKTPKVLVPKGMPPPRHSLVVVDTPGYGFNSQASWGHAVMNYLQARRMLRGAVVLLSSEKKLLPEDKWILRTLAEANTPTVVVLTKADKAKNGWVERCCVLADAVQQEIDGLNQESGGKWKNVEGAASHIYITATGMESPGRLKNGGGLGGVRIAILELAGFTLQDTVTKRADTAMYTGPVVSFDDIQWKA
ncbi:GTP-binding domain, HSR1-related protein [Metarhizium album ARSEF 1941]|uniref:GTP-binding domain, HSR1-related protein n=1 Tax=Metarhizium album (strain ARSEF 1941) TaxID=1081103 RepID=A0A0B2WIS2_METAS|nr:GTP-binding domain, HSR1-related protein [Metarhizium album ARSEF 1941]KHN95941.1 GTP-binding domain, HSR1-related protein [Metarhizium album ARSEF 1941]